MYPTLTDTYEAYRCPFPGCGKEFNVKSNMLRHYRSHTNPVPSSSSSSLHDIPTENSGSQIRTSLNAFFTEGQDQAGNLLQYSKSQPWQEMKGKEKERYYPHLYPMRSDRLTRTERRRGDDERDPYARHH